MEVICYVCNEQTDDWRRNFTELKSQHSNTPIVDFLKRFLDDFKSPRSIENESNCICAKCLDRIDDYDWLCVSCSEKEKELKELLWATEKSHIHQATVLLPKPEYILNPDVDSVVPPKEIKVEMDLDCEMKEEESNPKVEVMPDPISTENMSKLMVQVAECGKKFTYEITLDENKDAEVALTETESDNDCEIEDDPNFESDHEPDNSTSNKNESNVARRIVKAMQIKKNKTSRQIPDDDAKRLTSIQLKRYCKPCKTFFSRLKYYRVTSFFHQSIWNLKFLSVFFFHI